MNKTLPYDPNLDELLHTIRDYEETHGSISTIVLNLERIVPKYVIKNTNQSYQAIYEDNFGEYTFQIHKLSKNKYEVNVNDQMSKTFRDKETVLWEFESQLGDFVPLVCR